MCVLNACALHVFVLNVCVLNMYEFLKCVNLHVAPFRKDCEHALFGEITDPNSIAEMKCRSCGKCMKVTEIVPPEIFVSCHLGKDWNGVDQKALENMKRVLRSSGWNRRY